MPNEAPSSALLTKPEPPSAPKPAPVVSGMDALADQLRRMNDAGDAQQALVDTERKAAKEARDLYTEKATGELDRQREGLKPIKAEQATVDAQRAQLPVAEPYQEPEVPKQKTYPFLDTKGMSSADALATTITGLGLMAQMAVGISGGWGLGAMHAYSGALQGWAAGDQRRAEREWNEYLARVEKMSREWTHNRQRIDDIYRRYGADESALKAHLTIWGTEAKISQDQMALWQQAPDEAYRRLDFEARQLQDIRHQASTLSTQLVSQQIRQEMHADLERHRREMETGGGLGGVGGPGGFTPEAIDMAAQAYADGAALPPMGMGKSGTNARMQIINRAAAIRAGRGDAAGGLALQQAGYHANKAEMTKLQTLRGQVGAFEQTAQKNLDIALGLSDKTDRSGAPIFNRWLLAGRKATGDPQVAAFDAAVRVAINETAKVTSGASGGAVTSDSARREIESMLNTAQTPEQFRGVVGVLRQDMGNRMTGFDAQLDAVKQSIAGGPPSSSKSESTQPPATHRYNQQTGQVEEIK